jgi:hypothetical protein
MSPSPLEIVLDELEIDREGGDGSYLCHCPSHDDGTASLSVDEGSDGQVLLNCHAGCSTESILDTIGLDWSDLFPDDADSSWKPWDGTEVESYTYHDADANPLFKVVRYEMRDRDHPAYGQKSFLQKAYKPSDDDADEDGYVFGRKGVTPVLYRLPRVLEAAESGERVYVVEGEKDVQTLENRNLTATCNPGGASKDDPGKKWNEGMTEALDGARVVCLPDNDDPGRSFMEAIAEKLASTAASVKVLELPGLPYKGDVTDWIEDQGHDASDLQLLTEATDPFTPTTTGEPDAKEEAEHRAIAESGTYSAHGGRIWYTGGRTDKPVADFEAHISEEITLENGDRLYGIEGQTVHGRHFEVDVEASDFESSRDLKAHIGAAAGAKAAVHASMSKHLAPSIKLLSNGVEEKMRYRRTGWSPKGFLMPGRDFEGVEIEVEGDMPYHWADGEADEGKAREALEGLIEAIEPRATLPALAFLFTGPLVRGDLRKRVKRYGFFVRGQTGTLKTSWTQAAMSLWGPGWIEDENLIKFGEGTTSNAAITLASAAHDAVFYLDNFKPNTGRGGRDLVGFIHNVVEGGEKRRLNRNSQLQERRDLRTWPIMTGEDLPDTDSAMLARMLSVEFPARDDAGWNDALDAAQTHHEHLPLAMRTWIEWLEGEGADVAEEVMEGYSDRVDKWSRHLKSECPMAVNPKRTAQNMAANTLAFDVLTQSPLGDVFEGYRAEYQKAMADTVTNDMGAYTATSLEADRFLKGLSEMWATGRVLLLHRGQQKVQPDDQNVVGWYDDDGIYLSLDAAMKEVDRFYDRQGGLQGISNKALCSQLQSLDVIASQGSNRTTIQKWIEGKNRRVLHLDRMALQEGDGEGEAPNEDDDSAPF